MKTFLTAALCAATLIASAQQPALKTLTVNADAWAEGVPPQEVMVVDGTIRVAAKDGNKALMVDPNPIVDAYAQLGESAAGSAMITARFHATKRGRAYPRFGLSVHGGSGFRLSVNCAKKQIELVKDDVVLQSAPFTWTTDTWTHLRLDVLKVADAKWQIAAKAWAAGSPEPADAAIKLDHADPKMKGQGKVGVWGTPFPETPVYIDDISIGVQGK
jgi:hypothetical protein